MFGIILFTKKHICQAFEPRPGNLNELRLWEVDEPRDVKPLASLPWVEQELMVEFPLHVILPWYVIYLSRLLITRQDRGRLFLICRGCKLMG